MKYIYKYISLFIMLACFVSCQDDIIVEDLSHNESGNLPKTITISLGNDNTSSRLAYEETTISSLKALKTTWENDDVVYVNHYGTTQATSRIVSLSSYAQYKLIKGAGTSLGVFQLADNYRWENNDDRSSFWLYYDGNHNVHDDGGFLNCSYENQTQSGNNNMDHIKALHSVRAQLDLNKAFDAANIDLSEGVEQSSCIKLDLSGLPSIVPTKVSLITLDANNFWVDSFSKYNYLTEYWVSSSSCKDDKLHQLSLTLTNFTSTGSITAYMMMSNRSVSLKKGSKLRVIVESQNGTKYYADKEITSDKELKGGAYHILTISDTWKTYDVVSSKDYSKDGETETLQTATTTTGVDLVFMGDGFIDEDINNSTYRNALNQAYEDFFTVEPYYSLKYLFNVYFVTAVSENRIQITTNQDNPNGATGTASSTKFSTYFTPGSTAMGGNNSLVLEYAKKALGADADNRIKKAQVIVVVNATTHAGTNHSTIDTSTDYGASWGIAYIPMKNPKDDQTGEARRLTLVHEGGGHGVGKLADEYGGNTYYQNPSYAWAELAEYHGYGYYRNVDKYVENETTTENVYWSNLIAPYQDEELGVYAEGGAYTFARDFCRPSENSVMRDQFKEGGNYFNAASRWAIWYRIMKLTNSETDPTFDKFITWEQSIPQSTNESRSAISDNPAMDKLLPLAPPVYVKGQWINGRFVEEE